MSWRTRQYIFQGAEEFYDPDEDEDNESSDSSSSDSSSSCSSLPADETTRDKDVDEELQLVQNSETSKNPKIYSTITDVSSINDKTQNY